MYLFFLLDEIKKFILDQVKKKPEKVLTFKNNKTIYLFIYFKTVLLSKIMKLNDLEMTAFIHFIYLFYFIFSFRWACQEVKML